MSLQTEPKKASPWAKIPPSNTGLCSLTDVMSEQLACDLQMKEVSIEPVVPQGEEFLTNIHGTEAFLNVATQDCTDNDFLIAQLLQLEIDKEFDEDLKRRESVVNRNSHVAISYDKFKSVHPRTEIEENAMLAKVECTSTDESEDEITNLVFKRGVVGKGDQMKSKHDILLTNRHNAAKVMDFPPEFDTGDKHGLDLRLSNQVFNKLKSHSHQLGKRANRVKDKRDLATNEISLDPRTRLILFKFVNADLINSIGGVISTGKEATVFYAPGGKTQEVLVPKELAIKVFKTTLNEFKTREKYIADDYRFKDRFKHLNPQKIVRLWAEKEMHNLMKMRRFEIRCPDVVMLKKHVLVMSFIGNDCKAAVKLKDADLNEAELTLAYNECIKIVSDLYHKCRLVHADFNQFNTLWHEGHVWVIDVSQSVEPIHPMGFEFLLRDCTNIYKFFTSKKLEGVLTGEEIFNQITGMGFTGTGDLFLSQVQRFTKEKQNDINLPPEDVHYDHQAACSKEYNFDFYFNKSAAAECCSSSDDEEEGKEGESDLNHQKT